MSSLGFQWIHQVLVDAGFHVERAVLPDDPDAWAQAKAQLITIETETPVADFPVIGVSLAYELELAGLIRCLDLAGIPALRRDRDEHHPQILFGGPLTFSNPLPAAPFADAITDYLPGPGAGFGQDRLPDIVLGSPEGRGPFAGSLDVLSLGEGGVIFLEMTDLGIVDGPGPDLLVFENPFRGWLEAGAVAVSEDGITWHEWPCEPTNSDDDYPGCAGTAAVYLSSTGEIDPTDPEAAGGDGAAGNVDGAAAAGAGALGGRWHMARGWRMRRRR